MRESYEIAERLADGYKRWLKRQGLVTSPYNAHTYLTDNVTNWREQWGHVLTDNIAQALHDNLIR